MYVSLDSDEAQLWSDINARGWTHEHPEFEGFVEQRGDCCVAREGKARAFWPRLMACPEQREHLMVHEGVALFGGAATVPELRRRGLQAALLNERMRYASEQGCDLAMMVAEAGSNSQRNAERKGFRVAYTRLKCKLGELRAQLDSRASARSCNPFAVASPQAMAGVLWAMPKRPSGPSRIMPPWPPRRL